MNYILIIKEIFRHKHRFEWDNITVASLVSGAPVSTAYVGTCKCGESKVEITPAGYQQLSWGASPEYIATGIASEKDIQLMRRYTVAKNVGALSNDRK